MVMSDNKNDDDDELALFREEMRDAQPLKHDPLVHSKAKPDAKLRSHEDLNDMTRSESFSNMVSAQSVGSEEYLEYRGPGIQHRTFAKLRTGKIHIEAELDLHGMTLANTESILSEFLTQCQEDQIRYIRIIHGKGWSSKDNIPVLKSTLNLWLRQSTSVLAFCSATIDDGGTGALYVLLKKISQF